MLSFFKNLKYVFENEERLIICRFFDKLQFEYVNDGTGARIMARHISICHVWWLFFFQNLIYFHSDKILYYYKSKFFFILFGKIWQQGYLIFMYCIIPCSKINFWIETTKKKSFNLFQWNNWPTVLDNQKYYFNKRWKNHSKITLEQFWPP